MTDTKKPDVYAVMKLLDSARTVEQVQKKFKLAGATTDIEARRSTAVSTGLLTTDLLLNGGVYPSGWYTFFGLEQSAKSTHMMTAMTAMFHSGVPILAYFDPEGATSPDYIEAIAHATSTQATGSLDIKKVFGVRHPKTGDWVIEPRIHYSPENGLETVWKSIAAMLRRLPDKIYTEGEWWLLFDNTKENISRFKGQGDTKVGKRYGKIAIKSLDGGTAQALIIVDSYPALVSEVDDTDDGSNAIGTDARGHSKHVPKIKGQLKRKHCTLVGVNQLRDSINLTGSGPKFYEPGGHALKFYSDARMQQTPRSVPHGSGQLELEDSVLHNGKGEDQYRYICMRPTKNKFGVPHLEGWYRIWQSDPTGKGHGFCPVYDAWQYLKSTGQATGSIGRKIDIQLGRLSITGLTWLDFKRLILLEGEELKDFCKAKGLKKNPLIRERCFKQLRSGVGIDKYFTTLHKLDQELPEDIEEWTDAQLREYAEEHTLMKKTKLKRADRDALLLVVAEHREPVKEDSTGTD